MCRDDPNDGTDTRNRDGVFGRPRQRQTRREAGTQSYGLLTVRGGTDKATRLPQGWTGPVSMLGLPGIRKDVRFFFCAYRPIQIRVSRKDAMNAKESAEIRRGMRSFLGRVPIILLA